MSIGTIDETDRKEAFAAGGFAAQSALTGSGSVALHCDRDRIEPLIVPLDRVAGKTCHMPDDFFVGSNTISDEGRRYFRRLLPNGPISSCRSCEKSILNARLPGLFFVWHQPWTAVRGANLTFARPARREMDQTVAQRSISYVRWLSRAYLDLGSATDGNVAFPSSDIGRSAGERRSFSKFTREFAESRQSDKSNLPRVKDARRI